MPTRIFFVLLRHLFKNNIKKESYGRFFRNSHTWEQNGEDLRHIVKNRDLSARFITCRVHISVPNLRKNWINLKEMPVSVLSVIQTPNLLLLTHISVDLPLLRLLRSQTLKNSKRNYFHKTCISPNLVRVVPIKRNLSLY